MDLDETLRHALDGQAILFVGAGFSIQARNANGENLPTGAKLATLLANKLGLSTTPSLDIVSDMFVHDVGEFQLIQLLRTSLIATTVTPEQAIFGSVQWQRVYTTNYDNVIELADVHNRRRLDSRTFADSPSDLPANQATCVHINGFIERLDKKALHSSFVLTNTAYLTDNFDKSRWSRLFREDIEVARAVLFIGFSLYDLDIARVLFASSRIKQKCCFVVSETPSEEMVFSLSRFGTVAPVGAETAGRRLAELAATHVPTASPRVFNSFRVRSFTTGAVPSSTDVFNLYVKGQLNLKLLPAAFASVEPHYYLMRHELEEVVGRLDRDVAALVVHSYLGNGKTLLCEGVAFRAAQRGWQVLEFDRERATLALECEAIRRTTEPTLVIIENYHRHFELIERLLLQSNPFLRFLLTSRTPTHLTTRDRLLAVLAPVEPTDLAVDRLTADELAGIDRILEGAGLLGDAAALSVDRRIGKLHVECNARFCEILLSLLDAPHIQARLNEIFERLDAIPEVRELVVGTMVLQHIGAPTDLGTLTELCGVGRVNRALFSRDAETAELATVWHESIIARSPLFAARALRAFWASGLVQDLIVSILRRALTLRWDNKVYWDISRDLMRYSVMNVLMPRHQRAQYLGDYYETIKNLEGCAQNPFFWLQYTIARLSLKKYALAEINLQTAYAQASRIKSFDTYQIDNTKARFLLQRCIAGLNPEGALADFREANRILRVQISERRHGYYPFRVAALYGAFWDHLAHAWPENQRLTYFAACRWIYGMGRALDRSLAEHPDVRNCQEAMERVLANAGRGGAAKARG